MRYNTINQSINFIYCKSDTEKNRQRDILNIFRNYPGNFRSNLKSMFGGGAVETSKPSKNPSQFGKKPSTYKPSKPQYKPAKPSYKPSKPSYKPAKPSYKPPKPSYKPSKPSYKPWNGGNGGNGGGGGGGAGGGGPLDGITEALRNGQCQFKVFSLFFTSK